MQIRQMTLKELYEIYPLIAQLYPELSYEAFEDTVYEMRHNDYKMFGVLERGELMAFAGVSLLTSLKHKRHLGVFDFVTDEKWRFMGYGKHLLAFLEDYARSAMCNAVVLYVDKELEDARHFCAKQHYTLEQNIYTKSI